MMEQPSPSVCLQILCNVDSLSKPSANLACLFFHEFSWTIEVLNQRRVGGEGLLRVWWGVRAVVNASLLCVCVRVCVCVCVEGGAEG